METEEYQELLKMQGLICAGLKELTRLDEPFTQSQLDSWKYLTTKLLRVLPAAQVVDYVLEIMEGMSDIQFKCSTGWFYYDEGLVKDVKDAPVNVKIQVTSGVTGKINEKISIIKVAKEYGFKLHGTKAICLFHKDTDPSLIFNPSKNTFKCWSSNCGKHGNLIDFVYECEQAGLVRRKDEN